MSSLLSAELSATCNALGTYDKRTGKYLIDDFTLNTVKDLIRYLRRDGEDHEIRRHFGQTKVLQTDLLPMLIDHWKHTDLFDVTLRLLVNLTNPALLLYHEEVPVERTARHNYLQILSHLQSYKEEAFTKVETWNVFAKKLAKILEIDWSERDEDTGLIIERILILIRNVLHVPADLDREKRPENDASVHDQVLWALNQSGILDILLYMSSENEKQYFMHIIEIISHLLREQNPTSLADAALQRSVDEKLRDEQELLSIRMAENKNKLNKIKQYSATRHSRFGGTYVVQNMKSISDNELICLKPLNKISNINFNGSKKSKLVKPKNRRPVESGILERRSAFAIRLFLKEFCIEFLNSSYNPLMHYVKDVLVRAKAQQNDESYYLWAVKFFMEFNRGHNFQVGLVSETMSVPMFHYVQQQMEKYYDMIKVEKKKFATWVRRLHLALRAYKELLNTLLAMEKSSDSTVKESAKVLKSNIFYVLEYREFILSTFLNYDENKMPRSYLVDLVETVHLFLKMLEHYCKKTGLVVQKKVRKKTKSKKKKSNKSQSQKTKNPEPEIPPWEEIRAQLAAVLSSGTEHLAAPFDAASDVPIDQQKEDCMKNIQKLMRSHKFEDVVGMFRAAREVWPEEGIFGVNGIPEDEELEMLETIYNTDLGVENNDVVDENDTQENSDYDEEDEEEEEKSTTIVETDFNFQDFVSRFCHPRIVSACVYLLEGYDKNLPHTNHCIVKMLHRIAWDCQRPSMMFQATLFLTFQRILENPLEQFKEMEKFAIFILRKFTEVAAKNNKVFIELLFWKNSKDANEVQHGYDLYIDQKDKPGRGAWSEEQEEELRRLYMENQTNPETNQDVIDWILENLIDQTRTRRGVISKLKELGLIFKAPTKRSNKEMAKGRVPKEFSEEEDQQLRDLWDECKEIDDPMSVIISRMPKKRQKRSYVDRLLQLGIIQDKKECRKKRQKKSKVKSSGTDDDKSNADSSDQSDNEDDKRSSPKPIKRKAPNKAPKKYRESAKNNKKINVPQLSANEIAKLLVEAVDSGLTDGLKWLAENLEEVALDQEAEGYDPTAEGVPLVPISSESVEAMENKFFQQILKGIGVVPPSDEQETFWRIQSSLHFKTIRKRREIIMKAVHKEIILTDIPTANDVEQSQSMKSVEQSGNDESSDDDDLFNNLRKLRENVETPTRTNKSVNNDIVRRKRSRSVDPDERGKKAKMQKIDEYEELSLDRNDDDDDILSFAKKTLEQEEFPDTEDILKDLPTANSDDSAKEDEEDIVLPAKPANKKRRAVIDDDSD
ncbi:protein timeless homolog isoform X2 [Galleria mellonella]|uniref:Protein timeless homolog isoform X2 n=1 Tax=Galleria mellonella TaxID=7137 RepID=A0A6J3C5H8_GALME|nr:protein timeless homolog isoform X2 [Galleria mellonella]